MLGRGSSQRSCTALLQLQGLDASVVCIHIVLHTLKKVGAQFGDSDAV